MISVPLWYPVFQLDPLPAEPDVVVMGPLLASWFLGLWKRCLLRTFEHFIVPWNPVCVASVRE